MAPLRFLLGVGPILLGLAAGGADGQIVGTILGGGLDSPPGVALDAAGTLYGADETSNSISKLAPDGTVTPFVSASGAIPFAPGTARIFVRFLDEAGTLHGATSVAVETD